MPWIRQDPTDINDAFTATIKIVDDKPVISVVPALSEGEKSIRKYTVYGKVSLKDTDWIEVKAGKEGEYNFFKVTVQMKWCAGAKKCPQIDTNPHKSDLWRYLRICGQ